MKHEFHLQHQEKDSAQWFTLVNQLKAETEDPRGSQAAQLNKISEPQASKRHYPLKKKKIVMRAKADLWPLHVCKQT